MSSGGPSDGKTTIAARTEDVQRGQGPEPSMVSSTASASTPNSALEPSKQPALPQQTTVDEMTDATASSAATPPMTGEERPVSPAGSRGGVSAGYSSDSSAEAVDVAKMDPATLKARLKAQVEYYFSQQNLNRDAYMLSQMDADGYIAVSVIAAFKKVQKLTDNASSIAEAIGDSTICELSEDRTKIKTSWKRPARTTIILREVHADTKEEDIKALFDEASYSVVSARSDVGQTWFVTMATEDDAKNAVIYLLGKELHGQPVKARLKSEAIRPLQQQHSSQGSESQQPLLPGTNGVPPSAAFAGYQYGYGNMVNFGPQGMPPQWAYAYMDPAQAQMAAAAAATAGMGQVPGNSNSHNNRPNRSMSNQHPRGSGGRSGRGAVDRRRATSATSTGQYAGQGGQHTYNSNGGAAASGRGGRRNERNSGTGMTRKKYSKGPNNNNNNNNAGGSNSRRGAHPPKTPVFKPQDFPSLPAGKVPVDGAQVDAAAANVNQEATAQSKESSSADGSSSAQQQQPEAEKQLRQGVGASDPAQSTSKPAQADGASSWAAAVAKATPPASSKSATVGSSSSSSSGRAGVAPSNEASSDSTTEKAVPTQPRKSGQSPSQVPQARTDKAAAPSADTATQTQAPAAPPAAPAASAPAAAPAAPINGPPAPQPVRPKRGWEKPGISSAPKTTAAATSEVKQIVEDVVDRASAVGATGTGGDDAVASSSSSSSSGGKASAAPAAKVPASTTSSTEAASGSADAAPGAAATAPDEVAAPAGSGAAKDGEDETLLKTAFGAWGQKKSFADIIKSAPPAPTPAPAQAPAAVAAAPSSSRGRGGPSSSSSSERRDGSSHAPAPRRQAPPQAADSAGAEDGNWRSARR